MRITLVGGVERNEGAYRQVAEAAGHELSFHSGHVGGRGSATLEQMVRGCDWLIVVTIRPRFLILPGTEGLAGYADYGFHFRGFLIGSVITFFTSLLVAGVVAVWF